MNEHVVRVRVDLSGAPRSMIVNVEVDYERSWVFEEPGWQEIAFGVAEGRVYWWSARRLVLVPWNEDGEPATVSTDEDIRLAFAVPLGWILVCETSVRLMVGSQEVSRVELSDVLLAARWEESQLVVRAENGSDLRVVISNGRLAT
ncbi:MAG: hypothetical protein ABR600_06205 [Actinomycetota bacterium]|nr:hypothetical protein [Actinomycetota bacterium]